MGRSKKDGDAPVTVTQRTKWPVNWQEDKTNRQPKQPRGKLRRPRDPRKVRKIAVRPARKNPLFGRVKPYKNERTLVYEPEEYAFEDNDE